LAVLVLILLALHIAGYWCDEPYVIDVNVTPAAGDAKTGVVQGTVKGCGIYRWSGRSDFFLTLRPGSPPVRSHTRAQYFEVAVEATNTSDGSTVSYTVSVLRNHQVVASRAGSTRF
jgi:hypothetical protein